jgi:hypothetical protein
MDACDILFSLGSVNSGVGIGGIGSGLVPLKSQEKKKLRQKL